MGEVIISEELLDFLGKKFVKEKEAYEKSGAVFNWTFIAYVEKYLRGMQG